MFANPLSLKRSPGRTRTSDRSVNSGSGQSITPKHPQRFGARIARVDTLGDAWPASGHRSVTISTLESATAPPRAGTLRPLTDPSRRAHVAAGSPLFVGALALTHPPTDLEAALLLALLVLCPLMLVTGLGLGYWLGRRGGKR